MLNYSHENILCVDYAKFFAIFLMIVGHLLIVDSHAYSLIYLFHMPLFFLISGYLYKQKSEKENFLKIFWGLLIPYLFYQFLYLPLRLFDLVCLNGLNFVDTFVGCLHGILQAATVSNAPYIIVCGPCWFIMVMIQLRFIFNYVKINNKNLILMLIFSVLLSKFLIINNILLGCCLNCTIIAIPYFVIGLLLRNNNICLDKINPNKYFVFLYFIIAIFSLNKLLEYNGLIRVSRPLEHSLDTLSLFLMYIAALVGILMIILFSSLFKKHVGFVDRISKNTLFIIFSQEVCIFFLKLLNITQFLYKIQFIPLKFILILLFAFIVLFISYLCILFFEKHFPLILGKHMY